MELRDRVALVTGGGTGLGRAIALALADQGAHVGVNYSRSAAEAEATVRDLRGRGIRAEAFRADLAQPAEARRLIEQTLEAFGRLDILVNNAATTVFVPLSDLDGIGDEDWDRIMAVNLRAPWVLARAAAKPLAEQGGCILNVASVAAFRPAGSSLAYCVSKAGLVHLTRCLAAALAPRVRVNALAPGFMRTRWGARFDEAAVKGFEAGALLKRAVPVEDVAAAAVLLARNDSVTGETLVIDAGIVLR